MARFFRTVWIGILLSCGMLATEEASARLPVYFDDCNPWYPDKNTPKLTTPQWVGEDGVEAVIVLAIDDMRDPAKYEQYLRPILNRLKEIDGRAPVSIMTCDVRPEDPQLQSWLGEGLSIECHTIDHPCPLLQGGDFAKAKSTYDRCVDLLGKIPGNKPVAFRTPCCDSLNTVSPRFFAEIFSKTTENNNFLQIDSSVFTFFTSDDESLPKELVLDSSGQERFWKYLPKNNKYGGNVHNNFVNYIKNYPYPYVIHNSCWEIPCIAPSDWSAQHLQGVNNPATVEDWKAAIDLTVHKQGCFSLVFHPHGWIKSEQVVEMIDHAVAKHGKKVKFLNFQEVAERLNRSVHQGLSIREWFVDPPESLLQALSTAGSSRVPSLELTRFFSQYPEPEQNQHFNMFMRLEGDGPAMRFFHIADVNKTLAITTRNSQTELWIRDGGPDDWIRRRKLQPLKLDASTLQPLLREDGSENGFFVQDNHFCWINEDTSKLPDFMHRVSFDEILTAAETSGRASALRDDSTGSNTHDHDSTAERLNHTDLTVPIGAAFIDITPAFPTRLTGYGDRRKESEGVASKLHARALVIGTGGPSPGPACRAADSVDPACRAGRPPEAAPANDSASENATENSSDAQQNTSQQAAKSRPAGGTYTAGGTCNVLITVDNCGVPAEITEAVFAEVTRKHGIPRERFVISSTHSHSAPWLRGFAPNILTDVPANHQAHLDQYEKELTRRLVEVVDRAIESMRPGHLSLGFGSAGFAMNRRLLTNGRWTDFGEVPDGPTDKRLPVLAAHDTNGQLIAVLANYACHATTETGTFNQISGDWPGIAANLLEEEHPGAVALIAIGCGADANPSPRGTHEQAKAHGRTIADEVKRVLTGLATACRAADSAGQPPQAAPTNDSPPENAIAHANDAEQAPSQQAAKSRPAGGTYRCIDPVIHASMARIDLPLAALPTKEEWQKLAANPGAEGARARYFLQLLNEGKEIPTTIPNYPIQTWCFGDDLAMVFLGGEVVVDYSIRLNDMLDGDRLWINAYSNDVPCYIPSTRLLREGGYEVDSSMIYYRRPARLTPETEDLICDTVQKLLPHEFYSPKLQQDFPGPKTPQEALQTFTTKPDLKIVLAASEPLIRDPVAFDWDVSGRLWVVEMGDYPLGEATSGRVQILEDLDKDGVYDKATTFLDGLGFPNGIQCWRNGVIITMAPDVFYAEDTDGDGDADVRQTLYRGFVEGNQQHRVNGLRWGMDGWLYLANGDSGGDIVGTGEIPPQQASGRGPALQDRATSDIQSSDSSGNAATVSSAQPIALRGRDLRINPDTNALEAMSGQTQFGRERDDFSHWFGNNNSDPIYQYILEDRYLRRNPHAGISGTRARVSSIPGAAPVYPTSRTLARFNEFAFTNKFTSACGTMIYRDSFLGDQYYGNAFTSEPVHNLVSRLVMTRDGYGFKGDRAADEQQSEFLSSSDNWFRPTMIRTGPDGALWIADMYRAVIEHPEWIPPEYQRKMNLYAGNDKGRIYRIVPAAGCCSEESSEPRTKPEADGPKDNVAQDSRPAGGNYFQQPWNEIPVAELIVRLKSPNGWWRDTAQRILHHRQSEALRDETYQTFLNQIANSSDSPAVTVQSLSTAAFISGLNSTRGALKTALSHPSPEVRTAAVQLMEPALKSTPADAVTDLGPLVEDPDPGVRLQLMLSLGECPDGSAAELLGRMLKLNADHDTLRNAGLTSLTKENIGGVLNEALNVPADQLNEDLIGRLLAQASAMGQGELVVQPLTKLMASISNDSSAARFDRIAAALRDIMKTPQAAVVRQSAEFLSAAEQAAITAMNVAKNSAADADQRAAALRFVDATGTQISENQNSQDFLNPQTPAAVQIAAIRMLVRTADSTQTETLLSQLNSFDPSVRAEFIGLLIQRPSGTTQLLQALKSGTLTASDLDASQRDSLQNHSDGTIATAARELFSGSVLSNRQSVIDMYREQTASLTGDSAAGRAVFKKRCSTCHRLQNIGKEVGADLAALKDRSTEALLTAVLDPNRAVEAKFLSYTVITEDGLQLTGMLKSETGGSLTLVGSDGKEQTITRASIQELIASKRSLMPEGLEKDLSPQDLVNVIAFVQSSGTPWKLFAGNSPRLVPVSPDGTVTLPASAAEIYGPNLVYESKHGNLGFWTSPEDSARWTFEVPKTGRYMVEFDFACDDSTAGSLVRLSTGGRMLTARVPGSGTWDNYQTWNAGIIDLQRGKGQLSITAVEIPVSAVVDVRSIRLIHQPQ